MEHFIGISFWIATFFICLQAGPIPSDSAITLMRRHVTCVNDSKFYAPTNVKAECMATALECVGKELDGTVKAECNGTLEYVEQAVEFFEFKLTEKKHSAPATSAGCECERWPEAPFLEFLDKVESLLQQDASMRRAASPSAARRTSAADNELKLISSHLRDDQEATDSGVTS